MITKNIKNKCTVIVFISIFVILGSCSTRISIDNDKSIIPNEVVKQILQYLKLTMFFHPEVEGRIPVVIQSNLVDPNIKLILYDKPIVVIPDRNSKLATNLYISSFEDGKVNIKYPVEGVEGVFTFAPDNKGNWILENARVWEN